MVELPEQLEEGAREILTRMEPGVKLLAMDRLARHDSPGEAEPHGHSKLGFIIAAGLLFIPGIIFNRVLHDAPHSWAEYALLLTAYFLVGWPVILAAFRRILSGQYFDENFLMTIATGGAIAIHQLPEAVGVMLFYAVGEYLQDRAVQRSRRSITALLQIRPEYANLKEDRGVRRVRPEEVGAGATILIKPGEKVPLDGEIIKGSSFVDTSALTGESVPRKIESGGKILSGMINGQGLLTVRVSRPFEDSHAARILHLVEKAGERKAPTEQFITRFASIYTPLVVGAALLLALVPPLLVPGATFGQWLYRSLVLLVISCPCALVVSIPLGYFGGIGAASRSGILIKGANYLDALAELDRVVFDKTGTLTRGVFEVSEIVARNGMDEEEVLAAAAGAETFSNHPIAHSILAAYEKKSGQPMTGEGIQHYREIPAHGISALVGGRRVLAGNDRLMHREGIPHEDCDVAGTVVYVAIDGVYAGYIVISDEIREDARELVSRLKELGIRDTVMLSGDDRSVVERVGRELGIDSYFAELLPEEKIQKLEELEAGAEGGKRGKLAFVGDGINDAPVIVRADIGVAMGGLGSDAVIEAADVVLMEDAPSKLVKALEIARRTRRIVRQNIAMTLAIKGFFILMGALGAAGIWEAVFADVGVTVLAVLNAGRTLIK